MKASIQVRINYKDYRKIRKIFKAKRGESAASYFERLIKWLDDMHGY